MGIAVPYRTIAAAAGLAALGTTGIASTAGIASAASRAPHPAAALPLTAWVATQNGVVPISTATNKPGREIPPHASARAYALVASRNGKIIYDATGRTVSLISAATQKVTRQILVAGSMPGDMVGNLVLSPSGRTLYAQALIGNGVSELVPISTATSKAGRDIRIKCPQDDLAITPNGKTIYIVCPLANSVIPVSTATGKAGAPIRVGNFPGPIAITPDGKTAYVANDVSNSVTPINVITRKAAPAIRVGLGPTWIAITPDGKTAYVANEGTGHVDAHTVTPINTATNKAGRGIPIGTNANFILIAR